MKGILKNLHRYVLWALISLVFWAWIISRITDAPAARKVTLYADLPALDRQALSEALEKDLPAGIRFVEAWAFTDEMFSPGNVTMGDLFIVSEEQAETYLVSFAPIDESAFPAGPSIPSRARPTASASLTRRRASASGPGIWPSSPGRNITSFSVKNPSIWGRGTAPGTMPPCPSPGRC